MGKLFTYRKEGMYIGSIDLLRGLAALSVAGYHFICGGNLTFDNKGWVYSVGDLGYLGYYVFFIISGFVIPWTLHANRYTLKNYLTFIAKRIIRLEPPYLLSIALLLLLNYLSSLSPMFKGPAFSIDWQNLLFHIGYLNAFLGKPWLNPVFWTLAIEFQYYILMGIFYVIIISRKLSTRLIVYFIPLALFLIFRGAGHGRFLHNFLPLFMIGFLCFQKKSGFISFAEFFLLVVPLILISTTFHPLTPLLCFLTAYMILDFDVKRRGGVVLGKISYSLYLLHVPIGGKVVNLFSRWANTVLLKIAVVAIAFLVSLGAAALYYKFIEKPSMDLSKKIKYK